MHKMTCQCPKCSTGTGTGTEFETLAFEMSPEDGFETDDEASFEFDAQEVHAREDGYESEDESGFGALDGESPFSEEEEAELAMELLTVSSDAALDRFLGKLVKRAWRGVKKAGKIARPLGGVLKGLAKRALPFVGGALGSFIPIPGVGTAVGTALGSAVGNALEAEFGELEAGDQAFEMARRFVRIAGSAAQQAATAAGGAVEPRQAVHTALAGAARRHLPGLGRGGRGGRWVRRGKQIVVVGL
jgi:hypothetical protein